MRLIDADALLKDINDYPYGYRGMIKDTIARQPTVDPIKHGHWVYVGHGLAGESICKCSICGHQTPDDGNYCSYCGAQMDEVKVNNSKGLDFWMTKEQFSEIYEAEDDTDGE